MVDSWLPLGKVPRLHRSHKWWCRLGVSLGVDKEAWVCLGEGCDRTARPSHEGLHLHAGILEEAVGLPLHCVSQLHQL